MFAVIFPGQGSQTLGMARDFYDNFEEVRNLFKIIEKSTQINVSEIIFSNKNKLLDITEYTQICIYCVSISIFSLIKNMYGHNFMNNIRFMAGHSLGEYTALAAADVLKIDQCAQLLKLRGKFMQNSYPENKSGMLAIIGLKIEEVEKIQQDVQNKINFEIANDNSPTQIVISLKKEDFDKASSIIKEFGAKKVVPLKVSAGFHSSFMKSAEQQMTIELDRINFQDSTFPIISNYNASANTKSLDLLNNLKNQIVNRVRWVETIKLLDNNKVTNIIEIGPNKVLNNFNKRISNNFTFTNISNIEELYNLKNVF